MNIRLIFPIVSADLVTAYYRGRKENALAFGKKIKPENGKECFSVPQTYKNTHPYFGLGNIHPSPKTNFKLYTELREAVPVIDAAIMKLVRLIGKFNVECFDKRAQNELDSFLQNIKVGSASAGINSFISVFFEQLLTYGTAVGEMVADQNGIAALYNSDLSLLELSFGQNPLEIVVSVDNGFSDHTPIKYPNLLLVSTLNPTPDSAWGTSILKGLPFISDILLKIYNTIGTNWERIGNIRYAVTYKPQNDSADRTLSRQRAGEIAEQWGKTMQPSGPVKDFVAVGDVNIKVIGADNQIIDSEVPVRQMLEQIVAKLGIPPFLLGLNWSSTERMSSQQADILTSEIEYYRDILNQVIRKICKTFLAFKGYDCSFEISWESITLQDSLQQAQADYYSAQAKSISEKISQEE